LRERVIHERLRRLTDQPVVIPAVLGHANDRECSILNGDATPSGEDAPQNRRANVSFTTAAFGRLT
jgi:hypothetical protein